MLNSHCKNNDKKKKMKKICEKEYAEKCMRPPGREPTICGLLDNRANHYATESAASIEHYQLYKTNRK